MKTNKTLIAAIALSLFATTAMAQAGHSQRPALDANGDGVIDRAEAAKHPRLVAMFDRLDRNGDGRLDADERPQWKGRHHRGPRHGMRHAGPERLDTDGDGRLSRGEIAAAKFPGRDGTHPLLKHFDAIDANRDGYIVRGELRAWHERQRTQREAEMRKRFDERFAAADLNGDGKLSRVEVAEKMPRLADRFAWLDENRDGFLDRGELRPARGR